MVITTIARIVQTPSAKTCVILRNWKVSTAAADAHALPQER
jgi:hypothetical protein